MKGFRFGKLDEWNSKNTLDSGRMSQSFECVFSLNRKGIVKRVVWFNKDGATSIIVRLTFLGEEQLFTLRDGVKGSFDRMAYSSLVDENFVIITSLSMSNPRK